MDERRGCLLNLRRYQIPLIRTSIIACKIRNEVSTSPSLSLRRQLATFTHSRPHFLCSGMHAIESRERKRPEDLVKPYTAN